MHLLAFALLMAALDGPPPRVPPPIPQPPPETTPVDPAPLPEAELESRPLPALPSPRIADEQPSIDRWGWRGGLPDVAPAGWYLNDELRILHGRADLDNRRPNVAIGVTAAPRIEIGNRDADGFGGAVAFSYLSTLHVDEFGVRRKFETEGVDFDLLLMELRPIRPMRLNFRTGLGLGWLAYRREGGADPTAAPVEKTDEAGPIVAAVGGAANVGINLLFDGDADFSDDAPSVVGTAPNPRSLQVFSRSFTGVALHAGVDDTVVLGRSGTAVFAAADLRGVGGVDDLAYAYSARAGMRAFRRFGRYRLQLEGGYLTESWWLKPAGIPWDAGATFTFRGPFGRAEFKF